MVMIVYFIVYVLDNVCAPQWHSLNAGASIPPNTLEQVPPSRSPLPFPPRPLPLEVGPPYCG